jgi:uncharacterized damage-inducible protein DinB
VTLEAQLLAAWRRHNEILLYLLDHVPPEGLNAVPHGSRGRSVAGQFAHLEKVRGGWLEYHLTGKYPRQPGTDKENLPPAGVLHEVLAKSGSHVEELLGQAFRGEAKIRMFGKQPVRWMAYLIAHESHHRGQILLALKQNGLRLPEKIATDGLWGPWIDGA